MQVYVARQPILDGHMRLFGYELLYRSGIDNFFPPGTSLDAAAAYVIHNSIAAFDLDTLCPEGRAFINITRSVLVNELFRVLPADRVVIELLETIEADETVLSICRQARRDGYMLALDDFVLQPAFGPLLEIADIVKVDFLTTDAAGRRQLADRLSGTGTALLAEKVETRSEVAEAKALGYQYFQGYFYCRPEVVSTADVTPSKVTSLRFLAELQRTPADFTRLEAMIRVDVGLSMKLLRLINSASFHLRTPVTSLRHALTLLGESNFRRWASLVALASMCDQRPLELIRTALLRARFCEEIGRVGEVETRVDLFLTGLLSVADAVLGCPMSAALTRLGLAHELCQVLLAIPANVSPADLARPQPTPQHTVYGLAMAVEQACWDAADALASALHLSHERVASVYCDAMVWSADTIKSL